MDAVLVYIAQLYAVEKRARHCAIQGDALRLSREQASKPVLDPVRSLSFEDRRPTLAQKRRGPAVSHVQKNWKALTRYLQDGDLAIDTSHTERSLRGLAIGRHNWTFFGSDCGGKTMAILRSFVASWELLKLDPF